MKKSISLEQLLSMIPAGDLMWKDLYKSGFVELK